MKPTLTYYKNFYCNAEHTQGGEGGLAQVKVGGVGGQLPPTASQQHDVQGHQVQRDPCTIRVNN